MGPAPDCRDPDAAVESGRCGCDVGDEKVRAHWLDIVELGVVGMGGSVNEVSDRKGSFSLVRLVEGGSDGAMLMM